MGKKQLFKAGELDNIAFVVIFGSFMRKRESRIVI